MYQARVVEIAESTIIERPLLAIDDAFVSHCKTCPIRANTYKRTMNERLIQEIDRSASALFMDSELRPAGNTIWGEGRSSAISRDYIPRIKDE